MSNRIVQYINHIYIQIYEIKLYYLMQIILKYYDNNLKWYWQ